MATKLGSGGLGDCWFKRAPAADWEQGTIWNFDAHIAHGYAVIVSSADDGTFLIIPIKDLSNLAEDPGAKPEPKGPGLEHDKGPGAEHGRGPGPIASPRTGLGGHR